MSNSSTQFGVDIPLKSTYDGKGTNSAAKALKDLEKDLDAIGKKGKQSSGGIKELAAAFSGLAGVAVLIQQAREALESLNRQEQAMNALSIAAEKAGQSNEKVTKGVTEMADALKRAAGIDDDETIPAMIRTYQATGNVEKALTRARLAADLSVGGLLKYGEAHDMVSKAANGQTEELKRFGIVIDQTLPKKEQARRALEALEKQFGGSASQAKGNTVELAKLKVQYEDIRDSIVSKVVPSVSTLTRALGEFGDYAAGAVLTTIKSFTWLWEETKGLARAVKAYFKGDFDVAKGELAKLPELAKKSQAEIDEIWDAVAAKHEARWTDSAKAIELGHKDVRNAINDDLRSTTENMEAFFEKYRKNVEWVRFKLGPELLKAHQEANEKAAAGDREASDRALETARGVLRAFRDQEMDALRDRLEMAQTFQERRLAAIGFVDAAERRALEDLKEKHIETEAEIARVKEIYANRRAAISKRAALDETTAYLQSAGAILEVAGQVFEGNKGIAIALAIVNTALAVVSALKEPFPLNIALAAAAGAAGAVQIAKIQSTQAPKTTIGRGFDDPANDAAARMGGARWASDMVREWTSGVSAGWAHGMMRGGSSSSVTNSSTVDQSRHYNLEFSLPGVLDVHSVEQGKQLRRTLDSVGRQVDDGRVLSRRA